MPDNTYAMVQAEDTHTLTSLMALGWTITDSKDDWVHMEPPAGPPVLIRHDERQFEPEAGDPNYRPSITLRELELGTNDMLLVTAEDCPAEMVDQLREQIDRGLEDPDFSIIANFDIVMTTVRRPQPPSDSDSHR